MFVSKMRSVPAKRKKRERENRVEDFKIFHLFRNRKEFFLLDFFFILKTKKEREKKTKKKKEDGNIHYTERFLLFLSFVHEKMK